MGWTRSVDATVEPVSLEEAKLHLKLDVAEDDAAIVRMITAARSYCEEYTGRQLVTATYILSLDGFPAGAGVIRPPRPPLQTAGMIVAYVDSNGDAQTVDSADYDVDTYTEPGRIFPAYGEDWPSTQAHRDVVTVTFQAGYGDAAADVPGEFKQAVLLLLAQWYEHRGPTMQQSLSAEVALSLDSLLSVHRLIEV